MTAPLLSIVMPCLNAASTVGRALDSILEQGLDASELEVVVVDGGSTDGTLELLAARPGVRWRSEPDRGLSDAYNKGARAATGTYLGWLNADDTYAPGALRQVVDALRRSPDTVWLTGRCAITDADGEVIRRPVTAYKDVLLRQYSPALYLTQNFISAPSTFFRRETFLEVGGMDLDLRFSMDYDLYLRLANLADPVVLDTQLARFTMAEGTLSMENFERQFREHHDVAVRHGGRHRVAVRANRAMSTAIVLTYRAMRHLRTRGARPPGTPAADRP